MTHILSIVIGCNDNCLIYLLTCNKYINQYVAQVVDGFCFRWNNYKSNCRKHHRHERCMQQYLYGHFCDADHKGFISDAAITFIHKTDPSNPLKREDYWRRTLKTMAHLGFSTEDSKWLSHFFLTYFENACYCNVWQQEIFHYLAENIKHWDIRTI